MWMLVFVYILFPYCHCKIYTFHISLGSERPLRRQEMIFMQSVYRKHTSPTMAMVSFMGGNPSHPNERPTVR